jgi:hypothetical protein
VLLTELDAHALLRKPVAGQVLRELVELALSIDGDRLRRLSLTIEG